MSKSKQESEEIAPIYFKTHLRVLLYVGVDIIPIENRILRYLYYIYATFMIGLVVLFTVCEFLEVTLNFTDLKRMTFGLCYLISHVLGSWKVFIMIAQRKRLWTQFQKMEIGLFKPNMERGGSEEFRLIKTAIKYCDLQGNVFYILVLMIVSVRGLFAGLDPGVDKIILDPITNTSSTVHMKTMPYPIWCPFDYTSSPFFEIFYSFQLYSPAAFGLYIGSIDALICGMMMLFKAHFLILKRALDTAIERAESKALSDAPGNLEKTDDGLLAPQVQKYVEHFTKECISHHQQLIAFCDETEDVFSHLMLLQFLSSLLIICFQLFQLSLIPPSTFEFFSMVFYLMLIMFQILCYCWNGNEVQLVSENVASFIYEMDWICFNDKIKKSLLLMMMRSQRPCRFTAGKFALLSLQTFMAIVRGSGSYFMVLRQMNVNHPPINAKIGDSSLLPNSGFNSSNPTKIIIHGFKSSIQEDVFIVNKNDSGDYNVIAMDWSRLCQNEYLLAVQEAKRAGFVLSTFINWLTSLGVNSEQVHVVGHSLGAHVAGIAGELMTHDKRIGRITGLDPAGPGFKEVGVKMKLDKEDAIIVDVIHTYGKILSTPRPLGHFDFYPNGGRWQPGCPDIYDIWKMGESLQCNHARAYYLFAESIRNKRAFRSTKCVDIQHVFNGTCHLDSEVHMGQPDTYKEDGLYYVRTRSKEPFSY